MELVARIVVSSLMFRLFLMCCLRSPSTHVYVCHSVLVVLSLVFARCDRMSIRICCSVSAAPSLCIHPCRARQGSLDNRSDSFSTFIVVWFRRSSVRCLRCTTQTTSSVTVSLDVCRRHVESSWLNLWSSFNCNPWQWRFSTSPVRCSFHRQISSQEPPFAAECLSNFCLAQLHSW